MKVYLSLCLLYQQQNWVAKQTSKIIFISRFTNATMKKQNEHIKTQQYLSTQLITLQKTDSWLFGLGVSKHLLSQSKSWLKVFWSGVIFKHD